MSEGYNLICEIPTTSLFFGVWGVLKSAEKIVCPHNFYSVKDCKGYWPLGIR